MTILANRDLMGSWHLDSPGRRTIQFTASPRGAGTVTLEFQNHGLKPAYELQDWPKTLWVDLGPPNFRLHSLAVRTNSNGIAPTTLRRANGSILSFDYHGQQFSFFVDQPDDPIQTVQTLGRFHELEELELVRNQVPNGLAIPDVGAHVGNHTVYFEKALGANRVIPIEPDPRAQFLLRTNCALNGLSDVDFSYLSLALGAATSVGYLVRADPDDSGPTTLQQGQGSVPVFRGDDLLPPTTSISSRSTSQASNWRPFRAYQRQERCLPLIMTEVADSSSSRLAEMMNRWHFDFVWQLRGNQGRTSILASRKAFGLVAGTYSIAQSITNAPNSALRGH